MPPHVRFQRPTLPGPEAIERYLELARADRWFSNFGPCSELLRTRLEDRVGRPCVLVSNATLGLMAAVALALDDAPAGAVEAVVPSFAFAASAQAACWNGLAPVFVDVDEEHWHLDPKRLEEALAARKGRVGVVVALSSFGVPPPAAVRTTWEAICADAGVPLVVDSAAGFGAVGGDGVAIGGQGDFEVVSFHATKPMSSAEGGAVFCRTVELADELRRLVNFAFDDQHQALRPNGINAKMSEPIAAIGLASLDELDDLLAARRTRAAELLARLEPSFRTQHGSELGTWQFVTVRAPDARTREAVLDLSHQHEVGTRTYYDPLHQMPAFSGCARDSLDVTEALAATTVSLPMAVDLDDDEIARIAEMIADAAALGSAAAAQA